MKYSIEKITTLLGARRYGEKDANVRWLLTDSRSLCFPEETLFFALRTKRNDGHRYIDDLYRRGVRSFVVENKPLTAHPSTLHLISRGQLPCRSFATGSPAAAGRAPSRRIQHPHCGYYGQ